MEAPVLRDLVLDCQALASVLFCCWVNNVMIMLEEKSLAAPLIFLGVYPRGGIARLEPRPHFQGLFIAVVMWPPGSLDGCCPLPHRGLLFGSCCSKVHFLSLSFVQKIVFQKKMKALLSPASGWWVFSGGRRGPAASGKEGLRVDCLV